MDLIPVAKPSVSQIEKDYVAQALDSTWIGPSGEFLEKMKVHLSGVTGCRYIIPVSNGTVALHLALLALGIGQGDEVIVPSLTYIATVNAVAYCGATPIFVDVNYEDWCVNPARFEAAISKKTKAIIVVHAYGMPASMREITEIANRNNIRIVEDAAEAIFASYEGKPTGSLSDVATFSFFGNKVIATGEGGAVATNNGSIARHIELLKGQGMDPNRRYWFPIIGYNYRLTNVQAALFCGQFERQKEILDARWRIYEIYDQYFSAKDYLVLQSEIPKRIKAPWLYPLLLKENTKLNRDELMSALMKRGIETRPFFIPIHLMPMYSENSMNVELPETTKLSLSGMNLPTFVGLKDEQVEFIAKSVLEILDV